MRIPNAGLRGLSRALEGEWGHGEFGSSARVVVELGLGGDTLLKQLIGDIVRALVDRPDEVEIKEVVGDHAHVLELRVAKEDLGKVIGKGGAHASAIRTLMAAASGKERKRYILEIIEH